MFGLTRFANWIMRVYFDTPKALRWVFFALPAVYFLFPFDLIMDKLGLFGKLDDVILIVVLFWAIDRAQKFRGFHSEARQHGRERRRQEKEGPSAQAEPPIPRSPHEVLGISLGASNGEIKKAYRQLMARYHPDKFSHLGTDFEATAHRKTQEIVNAYQQLVR